ncbi:alpha/beta fold hydrolase [Nesterenkonia sp. Act20]|uniref:alpha/beta fold hydrolase n=1 Tax=Nesterenkonia sp. Act20 TaxID=1483432 RepID=UPI001C43A8C7|nr:alpha/beta hydrolase [Nesterenkonia sp. Act20]
MLDFHTTTVQLDDGAQLCVQTLGDHSDPALLLIGGATWSMDWWEDELCRRIANRRRMVIRYDTRDTGCSTHYPVGAPGYTSADLTTDAMAILDSLGVDQAHLVGISMGGGIAQSLALAHRSRVASLTLIATSPTDPGITGLPSPTPQISAASTAASTADNAVTPDPDWSDRDAVIDFILESARPYAGPGHFQETELRVLIARVFDRSTDIAASQTNHFLVVGDDPAQAPLSTLRGLPTLVLHGAADPLFPPAHGRALAEAIPGARLIMLDGVGHQLPPRATWDLVVEELIEHTR